MEARNGVGNFKADIEEVNSRIQGRAGTSLYIIAADGPATISREISEPLLPKHSLPFSLIELMRRGVRGLWKGYATRRARIVERKVYWLLRMEAAIRDLLFKSRLHELIRRPREYRIS